MDWMIRCVVLLSMMLQLVMAVGGTLRYRSANLVLQLVIWLGYMSADAVAIYALGWMAHSESRTMFGIWAPILLSHLGGPDSISAYSTQDNELWLRHLLTMLYQISVAVYVVYVSHSGGYLFAGSLLLLIVGVSKYAERTMALRYSSFSQIVSSAEPINEFMQEEGESCNYLVVGLTEWRKSRELRVTINDVWESEGQRLSESYLLCLSHALFKMAKRIYVNVYLHERNYNITRKFLFAEELSHLSSPEKIFTVVEVELKFLFDLLFSKSSGTAFSKVGTFMRLINMCLLGVSGFLIYSQLRTQITAEEEIYLDSKVAYVLVSVALVLEMVQFCRILVSDWTRVWLICARIQRSRRRRRIDSHAVILLEIAIKISSWIHKNCLGKYWRGQIPQYSVIYTCSHFSPYIWKLSKPLRLTGFVTRWYAHTEPVGDDLKMFIIKQLRERCSVEEDVESCRKRLISYETILENECEYVRENSQPDHEYLILHWHIATAICEMQYNGTAETVQDEETANNICVSRKLSRYCAYLLVSRPKLLPLHPVLANIRQIDVHDELVRLPYLDHDTIKNYCNDSITVGRGAGIARMLQEKPDQQRWKVISDFWVLVTISYAMKNKASLHAHQLTVGGEFLTLLWAIVGHMGLGDQWETTGK